MPIDKKLRAILDLAIALLSLDRLMTIGSLPTTGLGSIPVINWVFGIVAFLGLLTGVYLFFVDMFVER